MIARIHCAGHEDYWTHWSNRERASYRTLAGVYDDTDRDDMDGKLDWLEFKSSKI